MIKGEGENKMEKKIDYEVFYFKQDQKIFLGVVNQSKNAEDYILCCKLREKESTSVFLKEFGNGRYFLKEVDKDFLIIRNGIIFLKENNRMIFLNIEDLVDSATLAAFIINTQRFLREREFAMI